MNSSNINLSLYYLYRNEGNNFIFQFTGENDGQADIGKIVHDFKKFYRKGLNVYIGSYNIKCVKEIPIHEVIALKMLA